MTDRSDFGTIEFLVIVVGLLGGLNWLLINALDFNLVTDIIGSSSAGLAFIVIGVASALALADIFGFIEVEELGGDSRGQVTLMAATTRRRTMHPVVVLLTVFYFIILGAAVLLMVVSIGGGGL